MDSGEIIRKQLLDLLNGGNAHMGFNQAVEDFPMEFINTQPPGSDYTPWRLLEHVRIAQWDILEFIHNPEYISPPWPEGYWPPKDERAGPDRWQATIEAFRQDLQAMTALVEDPRSDLFASLPHAPGYTLLREVLVLADHNAYHMGEFAMLREIMGTWQKGEVGG